MDSFRTELNIRPSADRISLSDRILTVGSCFSDAMGAQLMSNKITCRVNPLGVVYNPHSIHKSILYVVDNQLPPADTFLQRDEFFLNYDFHSQFASLQQDDLKQRLKTTISESHHFLKNASWLIITYGTAWVYERTENNEVVANCHKMPAAQFAKSLLTQKKILESFESMYTRVKTVNPQLKFILTVSPVRHLKDTLELNSVSKSVLRVACNTLIEQHQDVHYFPSYEIMMDDLRDYRFYANDMIHPTSMAEAYIWKRFSECYFDEQLKSFLPKWQHIMTALSHKPFQHASPSHQKFVRETIKKLQELKDLVNVDEEIARLSQQLVN
jgi:hypothetical protein